MTNLHTYLSNVLDFYHPSFKPPLSPPPSPSPPPPPPVFFSVSLSHSLFLQEKMDKTLFLLQNKDPADAALDDSELVQLEGIN